MGSKSKAPPPPDYTKLALEQARLQNELVDKQTAANRVNQVTALGQVNWSQDPVTGQWTQTETWNPEVLQAQKDALAWDIEQRNWERDRMGFESQRMAQESQRMQQQLGYDKQRADYEVERMKQSGAFEADLMAYERQRMANETERMGKQSVYDDARQAYSMDAMTDASAYNKQRMGFEGEKMGFARDQMGAARSLMDKITAQGQGPGFSGGPAMPTYDGGFGGEFADKFYKSATMRLLPEQARQTESLTNKLRLQGLQPGTRAFDQAMQNLTTSQGDINAKASIDAELAGVGAARDNYLAQLQGQGQAFDQSAQSYLLPWQAIQMQSQSLQGLGNGIGAGVGGDIFGNVGGDIYGGAGQGIAYGLGSGAGGNDLYQGAGQGIGSNFGQGIESNINPNYQAYNQAGAYEGPKIYDAAKDAYAQKMQAYNEQQQKKSSKGSSIGSIVGTIGGSFFGMPQVGAAAGGALGGMFSDVRLKHDIQPLSDEECYEKLKNIIPIRWKWNGTSVEDSGISAQQILDELPYLTDRTERGLLAVNYTALFAMLLGGFRHLASKQESENAAV